MADSSARTQKERHETDGSLRDERAKTDAELAKRRAGVEHDADAVLDLAQQRADAVVETARARADERLDRAGATKAEREVVRRERATEDSVLAGERVAARERLLIERANRAELIAELLLLERTRTDEALAVERAGADAELTAREDVLGMVSHDLRTLLQGVAMSAWAIIDKAGDEPFVRGEAKRTQRFVMRMEHLISDLLDLASIEAGKLRVSASDHDAGSVVRETAEIFAPLAAAEALALVVDLREESVPAWLDRERILQVLANLVSNAIKFTEAGGTITVGARAVDSGVELFVRDTGRGIPADRLARIFERYVQASVDRRGLGLGLYISRSIVEAHGGSARVESEVGVGSTFSFVLPSRTPTR